MQGLDERGRTSSCNNWRLELILVAQSLFLEAWFVFIGGDGPALAVVNHSLHLMSIVWHIANEKRRILFIDL